MAHEYSKRIPKREGAMLLDEFKIDNKLPTNQNKRDQKVAGKLSLNKILQEIAP